jgi:hypothetical protein
MLAKAAAVAAAQAKSEYARHEQSLRSEVQARAGSLKPMLQEVYNLMDPMARAIFAGPGAKIITENPEVITSVILPALSAIEMPGAKLLQKLVALVGVAEMAGPIATLIGIGGEMIDKDAPPRR